MTPDSRIVKKVKNYDPDLYLKWNSEGKWFELWRKRIGFSQLITPVTQSIYDTSKPKEFVELDERLLWWIYYADSHKTSPKEHALESDDRWKKFIKTMDQSKRRTFKDAAKDMWCGLNNFYYTKYPKKQSGPTWNKHKPVTKWVNPDSRGLNPRIWKRSKGNTLRYRYAK